MREPKAGLAVTLLTRKTGVELSRCLRFTNCCTAELTSGLQRSLQRLGGYRFTKRSCRKTLAIILLSTCARGNEPSLLVIKNAVCGLNLTGGSNSPLSAHIALTQRSYCSCIAHLVGMNPSACAIMMKAQKPLNPGPICGNSARSQLPYVAYRFVLVEHLDISIVLRKICSVNSRSPILRKILRKRKYGACQGFQSQVL
jgi:hypothetical protein